MAASSIVFTVGTASFSKELVIPDVFDSSELMLFLFSAVTAKISAINNNESAVKKGSNPGAVSKSPGTGSDHDAIITMMVSMTRKPAAIRSSVGEA